MKEKARSTGDIPEETSKELSKPSSKSQTQLESIKEAPKESLVISLPEISENVVTEKRLPAKSEPCLNAEPVELGKFEKSSGLENIPSEVKNEKSLPKNHDPLTNSTQSLPSPIKAAKEKESEQEEEEDIDDDEDWKDEDDYNEESSEDKDIEEEPYGIIIDPSDSWTKDGLKDLKALLSGGTLPGVKISMDPVDKMIPTIPLFGSSFLRDYEEPVNDYRSIFKSGHSGVVKRKNPDLIRPYDPRADRQHLNQQQTINVDYQELDDLDAKTVSDSKKCYLKLKCSFEKDKTAELILEDDESLLAGILRLYEKAYKWQSRLSRIFKN